MGAWLGFYNSIHIRRLRMTKEELVDTANKYASDVLELEDQPAILQNTIKKMGLKDVKGLKILEETEAAEAEDWLEEDMVEEGSKKKKTKWDQDESWWKDGDEDWYGKKSSKNKSSKSKSKKWDESWDEWGKDDGSKKDKKTGKKFSNKQTWEEEYTNEQWAAWEAEKKAKKAAKKEKDGAKKSDAKESIIAAGDNDELGAAEMEQYFDEATGEMKFRGKPAAGSKKKKEKAAAEKEYTEEEWAAWEAEKKAKKAAKKAAKEAEAAAEKSVEAAEKTVEAEA